MKQLKKVLILSASAGTGHVRAAAALETVCRNTPGIGEVVNVDALSFTNKLFRDFYSKLYLALAQDAPTLLGWWYFARSTEYSATRSPDFKAPTRHHGVHSLYAC